MIEIYGLYCPDSGALRYVGKAKSAASRLKRHLAESKYCTRPVNYWIKSLLDSGKLPHLKVLETATHEDWKSAEIRLIALHRQTSDLLNVADGGDRPSQTDDQRKRAALASNRKQATKDPRLKRLQWARMRMAAQARFFQKQGRLDLYEEMRATMNRLAVEKPHLHGSWAGWK